MPALKLRKPSHVWVWVRVALSIGALTAVLIKVDIAATASVLRSADPVLVAAALAVNWLGVMLSTALWRLFEREPRPAYGSMLSSYLRGLFLNNIGVGTVIGDASRAADMRRDGGLLGSATAVLQERVASLLALVLLAAAGSLLWFRHDPRLVAGVLSGLLALLGMLWLGIRVERWAARAPRCPERVREKLQWLGDMVSGLIGDRSRLIGAAVLALGVQSTTVAATFVMLHAAGADVNFVAVAALTPLVALAVLAPFSIQGIGVREASYIQMFGLAGVHAPLALSAAMLSYASTVAISLVGGAFMVLHRRRLRPAMTWEPVGAAEVRDLAA